jgi:hypothetical protein
MMIKAMKQVKVELAKVGVVVVVVVVVMVMVMIVSTHLCHLGFELYHGFDHHHHDHHDHHTPVRWRRRRQPCSSHGKSTQRRYLHLFKHNRHKISFFLLCGTLHMFGHNKNNIFFSFPLSVSVSVQQ